MTKDCKCKTLGWLEFGKPAIPDLNELIPGQKSGRHTLTLGENTVVSDTLRDGITKLLNDAGLVNTANPEEILRALEGYPDGYGLRMVRNILRPGRTG